MRNLLSPKVRNASENTHLKSVSTFEEGEHLLARRPATTPLRGEGSLGGHTHGTTLKQMFLTPQ
jgi:hypothetical protein